MKGCSVHYFFFGERGEAFHPVQDLNIDEPVGYQRNKVSMDYSMRAKIPCAPGIYEGDFRMHTGGDGKSVLKLYDVKFLEPLNIKELFDKAAAFDAPVPASSKAGTSK